MDRIYHNLPDRYKIIETDNYDGDYPDEKFINLPSMNKEDAERLADLINNICNPTGNGSRFWRVVDTDYELQPGFEP